MNKTAAFLLTLALIIPACSEKSGKAPAASQKPAYKVCADPIDVKVLEQGSFNLAYWLENGPNGRVLVHISAVDGLAPVDKASFDSLAGLANKGDLESLRLRGDITRPGALYSSRNIVFLAHQLNMIDTVYWVVPTFGSITEENAGEFKNYLKTNYPGQAKDIDGLKLAGNVLEGNVNGLDVKLVGLKDIPVMEKPVILDIDGSFISSLYRGEKETRVLSVISGFFATLRERKLFSDSVTISASNEDGAVPVKFRFLADYLSRMFKEPGMIDKSPPELWTERADAWKAEQKSPKESIAIYKNIIKKHPDDAATRYDLSYAYFLLGDLASCKSELAGAVKLDPGYAPAYRDYANSLEQSGRKDKADAFLKLANDKG